MELWLPSLIALSVLLILALSTSSSAWCDSSSSSSEEEERAVERFRNYLRIRSDQPNPDYDAIAGFLLDQAASIGLQARTLEFADKKPLLLLSWTGKNPSLPSVLLNSHTDVVTAEPQKWLHSPFAAHIDANGNIYARGSQDVKCIGMQYLEAIRVLKTELGFQPLRSLHISFVPDEEIGGKDGMGSFVQSSAFSDLNVGIVLDEGLPSPGSHYRVFNGERSPCGFVIKATGAPGHGSKLYDNSALENLMKSFEYITRFRQVQLDLVKAGRAAEGEVTSINPVFLKAGTPSPTGFVMNMQPSEAEAGFDMRVPPFADIAALQARMEYEWAPAWRNMTYRFGHNMALPSSQGMPLITAANESNPWWILLKQAVLRAGGELREPEIRPSTTDSRYVREKGIPAFGFSPMANTPILLHDHNEYLNKQQYLQGIKVYMEIIKSFLSLDDHGPADVASRAEL